MHTQEQKYVYAVHVCLSQRRIKLVLVSKVRLKSMNAIPLRLISFTALVSSLSSPRCRSKMPIGLSQWRVRVGTFLQSKIYLDATRRKKSGKKHAQNLFGCTFGCSSCDKCNTDSCTPRCVRSKGIYYISSIMTTCMIHARAVVYMHDCAAFNMHIQ